MSYAAEHRLRLLTLLKRFNVNPSLPHLTTTETRKKALRQAYYQLAKQAHPDAAPDHLRDRAERNFIALHKQYEEARDLLDSVNLEEHAAGSGGPDPNRGGNTGNPFTRQTSSARAGGNRPFEDFWRYEHVDEGAYHSDANEHARRYAFYRRGAAAGSADGAQHYYWAERDPQYLPSTKIGVKDKAKGIFLTAGIALGFFLGSRAGNKRPDYYQQGVEGERPVGLTKYDSTKGGTWVDSEPSKAESLEVYLKPTLLRLADFGLDLAGPMRDVYDRRDYFRGSRMFRRTRSDPLVVDSGASSPEPLRRRPAASDRFVRPPRPQASDPRSEVWIITPPWYRGSVPSAALATPDEAREAVATRGSVELYDPVAGLQLREKDRGEKDLRTPARSPVLEDSTRYGDISGLHRTRSSTVGAGDCDFDANGNNSAWSSPGQLSDSDVEGSVGEGVDVQRDRSSVDPRTLSRSSRAELLKRKRQRDEIERSAAFAMNTEKSSGGGGSASPPVPGYNRFDSNPFSLPNAVGRIFGL
eukprot:g3572.t1